MNGLCNSNRLGVKGEGVADANEPVHNGRRKREREVLESDSLYIASSVLECVPDAVLHWHTHLDPV